MLLCREEEDESGAVSEEEPEHPSQNRLSFSAPGLFIIPFGMEEHLLQAWGHDRRKTTSVDGMDVIRHVLEQKLELGALTAFSPFGDRETRDTGTVTETGGPTRKEEEPPTCMAFLTPFNEPNAPAVGREEPGAE